MIIMWISNAAKTFKWVNQMLATPRWSDAQFNEVESLNTSGRCNRVLSPWLCLLKTGSNVCKEFDYVIHLRIVFVFCKSRRRVTALSGFSVMYKISVDSLIFRHSPLIRESQEIYFACFRGLWIPVGRFKISIRRIHVITKNPSHIVLNMQRSFIPQINGVQTYAVWEDLSIDIKRVCVRQVVGYLV